MSVKVDFHSVEFSEWTENPLFTREAVALNLNKKFRVTDLLLCLFPSVRKILLSGNQPKGVCLEIQNRPLAILQKSLDRAISLFIFIHQVRLSGVRALLRTFENSTKCDEISFDLKSFLE